jgi:hypothetical protein
MPVFDPTEILKGWLIFPDLLAIWLPESRTAWENRACFTSIEMLEGWLIFPDLHTNRSPDSTKSSKNTAFPPQSKRLMRSATEKSISP